MSKEKKLVWVDGIGDLRKETESNSSNDPVNVKSVCLHLRRLTAGKGRTVTEISALPNNKKWCKDLSKSLKSKLGVGGTYKNGIIELSGEKVPEVTKYLDSKQIKWKKVGG